MEERLEEARILFKRPPQEAAPMLASFWRVENDKTIHNGSKTPLLIGVHNPNSDLDPRFQRPLWLVRELATYSHESTMSRWKNTRGPEIDRLNPSQVICYNSRGTYLSFIKTEGAGNLWISSLQAVDRLGDPLLGDEHILKPGQASQALGLEPTPERRLGQLYTFDFRDKQAMLLWVGAKEPTVDEYSNLVAEILSRLEK